MQLEFVDILFLPMLFLIGIETSWEDYHTGKIRNKWIVVGMVYALVILLGMLVWNFIAEPVSQFYYTYIEHQELDGAGLLYTISWDYFGKVALNSSFALLLGFFLWKYNLIAAGDAKLFFVFTLLLPLKYYWKSYLPYFPSFVLLINIFLPAFFFIFLKASLYILKKIWLYLRGELAIEKEKILSALNKEAIGLIKLFIGFAVIFLFMGRFRDLIAPWIVPHLPNEGFLFIFFFLLYRPLYAILRKNRFVFWAALAVFIFYTARGLLQAPEETLIELQGMIKIVASFMLVIIILRKLSDFYIMKSAIKKINVNNLKPGMRLAGVKVTYMGHELKGDLNQERVKIVKEWAKKNNFKKIGIYQKFPFAMWMFLGVVLTLVFKGSVINVLRGFI